MTKIFVGKMKHYGVSDMKKKFSENNCTRINLALQNSAQNKKNEN